MRVFFSLAFTVLVASSLSAQPARTFVASTGSDVNPCSLSSPCRSFQAGFNAVAAGGEVIALDSAGYGVITISRAVSIEAPPGVYGGITAGAGATGIVIAGTAANDSVILRGLTFNGLGTATNAIDFQSPALLAVDSCVISGFAQVGILAEPSSASSAHISIVNTTVRGGTYAINFGTAVPGSIDNCRIENAFYGVRSDSPGTSVGIRNTVFENDLDAVSLTALGTPSAHFELESCIIEHSADMAVFCNSSGAISSINVSNTVIVLNNVGLAATGNCIIESFGNNKLVDNTTQGGFHGTIGQQ